MTNRQYLANPSDDDLAEWLCKQIFGSKAEGKLIYGADQVTDAMIYHTMRNFLKLEYHALYENLPWIECIAVYITT